MNNPNCPVCGGEAQRGAKPLTLTYKDQSITFDMPGWYCGSCDEAIHDGKDMQESDRQLNLLKATADNVLLPAEIRRIRKRLSLSQELAGKVLGGGPNAFNKYETGMIVPSQAVSNLLRVLDAQPDVLSLLKEKLPAAQDAASSRLRSAGNAVRKSRAKSKVLV